MFIWSSGLPLSYSEELSCPSHSRSKGDIAWKTEPWSTAAPPCISTPIVSTPLSVEYWEIGGGGEHHGDGRASWDRGTPPATRSPSLWGPVSQSRKLSFEAPSTLWSVSLAQTQPPTPNPIRAPHLHPPYPPISSPALPLLLPSFPEWPPLEIRCPPSPKKLSPYPPPPLSPTQAISKIWTWKKKTEEEEWHRKSLVSLLQTKYGLKC